MSFCTNCGLELQEGAARCERCGTIINKNISNETFHQQRQQVFVGVVRKCPSCGAELNSMEAVCPNCGHEINSIQVSQYLSDFINKLDECEQEISDEEESNREAELKNPHGWKSWSRGAKVFWIILNIFALCAPLIIYGFYKSFKQSRLTPCEKRKNGLIENFQIPNEKQAIVDTLSFIKGKVNALSILKVDSNSWHWMKLWYVKATHIREKASLIMPEDKAVETIFQDIAAHNEKMHHAIRRKHILWITGVIAYLIVIAVGIKFLSSLDHPAITTLFYHGDDAANRFPIICIFIFAVLITFLAWLPKRWASGFKLIVTIIIWIGVILVNFYYQKEIAHDNYINFSREIDQLCADNGVLLTGIRENKKDLYIDIQSISYEGDMIDSIEKEVTKINEKYHYEIHLSISDENGITIRETKTDESGIVERSKDNTNGFISDLNEICSNNGVVLDDFESGSSNDVSIKIISPYDDTNKIDRLINDIISAYTSYDYRSLTINIKDRDKNDIKQIDIDQFGTQTTIDVLTTTSTLTHLCEEKGMILKRSLISGNRVVFTVQVSTYNAEVVSTFASAVSQVISTTIPDLSIDIKENDNLAYRIVKNEFNDWVNINVHDFTEQIEAICKKRNVVLSSISYTYSLDEVSVYIDARTGKKRESNNIESDITKLLKKSDFKSVSLTVYSPSSSTYAIRESSITAAGATQTLDRTE